MTIVDHTGVIRVIHYGSIKSKQATRNVIAAELHAMVQGFHISSTIRLTAIEITGRLIPLEIYTDSKFLQNSLISINSTTIKRLFIDLQMPRCPSKRREIIDVFWILRSQNSADMLTK